jgi:hypothetical protein
VYAVKKVLLFSILLVVLTPFAYPSCSTLDITDEGIGGWFLNTAGSYQLHACCATAPYTFTLSSGSFAPGVSVNSSGLISGTPTSTGFFTPCIKVTDAAGCTLTKCFSQEVD